MRIEKVKANLEKAEKECRAWRKAIAVYERCEGEPIGEYPESVFRLYILTGTVENTAKALNDAGQRNGGRRFQSNDIGQIIDSTEIDDADLKNVSRFLLSNGRYFIDALFN